MAPVSFLDISLDTANKFYSWGWKSSLVGAAITLMGVILLMWGTKVRDHDFESQMTHLNTETAKANEKVATLTKESESLKTEALKAKEGIAKAQAQAAQANEKAESERLARVKLEISLLPRHFTEQQRKKLIEILRQGPKGQIDIVCILGNAESFAFASEIYAVLKTVGWKTSGVNQGAFTPNNPIGLIIGVKNARTAPKYATLLHEALKDIGFVSPGEEDPKIPSDEIIKITVGVKP